MLTFAAPIPVTDSLAYDTTIVPGSQPLALTVTGKNLTPSSQVIFRTDTLPTTYVSIAQVNATIPTFFGNPPIYIYTPPITPNKTDGGNSDTLYFNSPIKKECGYNR